MKFVIERDDINWVVRFRGEVTQNDLVRLPLDAFDLRLLAECDRDPTSAADRLLALEMLFRRDEQSMRVKPDGAPCEPMSARRWRWLP